MDTKNNKKKGNTYCCVPQCNNYNKEGLSFHIFPTDDKLRKRWESVLRLGKPSSNYMRVCSEHFTELDYFPGTAKSRRKLKRDVIPSKKLPVRQHDKQLTVEKQLCINQRSERAQRRHNSSVSVNNDIQKNEVEVKNPIQEEEFNLSSTDYTKIALSENAVKTDAVTQTYLSPIHLIITSKANLYTYTGIHTFELLDGIVKCVSDLDPESMTNKKILDLKDRVILTFVKLKLNLTFCTLEPLFGVSRHTCAFYFKKMIVLLAEVFRSVIPWPSQEEIRANLPVAFKNYRTTRVVIDCAETPVERSNCLKCRILTYSHYKKGHTVKFKLGIAPSGLITSVSRCYGGRASDKVITLESHILDKMDLQDAVMADKGFFIEKECLERHLILHQPPFLSKKKQLSREEALKSAEIARARVHVERVIQRVREFEVISGKVAWSLLPYFEDCLIVACGMTNLSSPVLNVDKFM